MRAAIIVVLVAIIALMLGAITLRWYLRVRETERNHEPGPHRDDLLHEARVWQVRVVCVLFESNRERLPLPKTESPGFVSVPKLLMF